MRKVAMLLMSALDHDSRVRKEIAALQKADFKVTALTVNSTKRAPCEHVSISHAHRRVLVPGMSAAILYARFIRQAINLRKHDVVHCNDLNTLPVGVLLKALSWGRIRIVYDAHEFESNQVPNQSGWSIWYLQTLERALIQFADVVVTVSQSIANEYQRLYGIRPPKVVLNCPPYRPVRAKHDLFRSALGIGPDQKIFLYQGGLTFGRGIELLLKTFDGPKRHSVIVFMGYGPLERMIKQHAAISENIFFYPAVSSDNLLDYTSSADVGIVVAENVCRSYDYSLPNKLFEFVMAGLPVVTSNLTEMRQFVESNGIGVVVSENSVRAVEEAMQTVLRLDLKRVAARLDALRSVYCWEQQELSLRCAYREIESANPEPGRA